ncbi:MAG: hypothetical protein WBB01_21145 [Phormidesmis sp.]
MVNKYTLGGIVLGIFLMAIWGARRAITWTPDSAAQTLPADGTPVSDANQVGGNAGRPADDSFVTQTDGSADDSSALTPVEEAGTYIQRQQRAEEDGAVAGTSVTVIPAADNGTVSAQGNTTVEPQPDSPEPAATTAPAQPGATAPAVPALW